MTEAQWLSLAVCGTIALCHVAALPIWQSLRRWRAEVSSFAGGAAAAYVFLCLLPELETTHAYIGERIHVIVLVGFVILFTADTIVMSWGRAEHGHRHYVIRLALGLVYTLLLAFTLSSQLPLSLLTTLGYAVALGMHVVTVDLAFIDSFGPHRHRFGRYLLAAAALGGWALSLATTPPEVALDVVTALMAGFIIFTVFGEELAQRRATRLMWFVLGAFAYFLLDLVAAS